MWSDENGIGAPGNYFNRDNRSELSDETRVKDKIFISTVVGQKLLSFSILKISLQDHQKAEENETRIII